MQRRAWQGSGGLFATAFCRLRVEYSDVLQQAALHDLNTFIRPLGQHSTESRDLGL
jgi:hypothetical protein